MNKIVRKEQFSEKVFLFEIEAPLIANSRKAGNFVIVRVGQKGERMPLTIAGADKDKGTITLVVQQVGLSSKKLCMLNEGDFVTDVVGPLGNPTHIENFGTVVCAGGGLGVAPMLPIIQALKAAGNRVLSVMAGRSKDLIILEDKVRESSDEVIIRDCLMQRSRASMIRELDHIRTPLLLLHGSSDTRSAFEQSEQLFVGLHERHPEIPVRLVMFPGANHSISQEGLLPHRVCLVQEMVNWFDRYLKHEEATV